MKRPISFLIKTNYLINSEWFDLSLNYIFNLNSSDKKSNYHFFTQWLPNFGLCLSAKKMYIALYRHIFVVSGSGMSWLVCSSWVRIVSRHKVLEWLCWAVLGLVWFLQQNIIIYIKRKWTGKYYNLYRSECNAIWDLNLHIYKPIANFQKLSCVGSPARSDVRNELIVIILLSMKTMAEFRVLFLVDFS